MPSSLGSFHHRCIVGFETLRKKMFTLNVGQETILHIKATWQCKGMDQGSDAEWPSTVDTDGPKGGVRCKSGWNQKKGQRKEGVGVGQIFQSSDVCLNT